jgi:Uma2 family endonuclease
MGTKSALSADQYLRTSYPDLDREFRDGEVVERSLPTYLHGKTKFRLLVFFGVLPKALLLHACAETRMKIRETLYLIPDVAVFHPDEPAEVPDSPPLVAIEVRSENDRICLAGQPLLEAFLRP